MIHENCFCLQSINFIDFFLHPVFVFFFVPKSLSFKTKSSLLYKPDDEIQICFLVPFNKPKLYKKRKPKNKRDLKALKGSKSNSFELPKVILSLVLLVRLSSIFFRFYSDIGPIWSNFGLILVWFWSEFVRILIRFWCNIGLILVWFWSDFVPILFR